MRLLTFVAVTGAMLALLSCGGEDVSSKQASQPPEPPSKPKGPSGDDRPVTLFGGSLKFYATDGQGFKDDGGNNFYYIFSEGTNKVTTILYMTQTEPEILAMAASDGYSVAGTYKQASVVTVKSNDKGAALAIYAKDSYPGDPKNNKKRENNDAKLDTITFTNVQVLGDSNTVTDLGCSRDPSGSIVTCPFGNKQPRVIFSVVKPATR
jgi:hypothetical protein